MSIEEKLSEVNERIAAACDRAGRDVSDVKLVAVTKTRSVAVIREAMAAGMVDVGENYVQEMRDKQAEMEQGPHWHYIGHLQRNKVKYIAPWVHMIHTIDSLRLAQEVDKRAAGHQRCIPILVQVNIAREDVKSGCDPDEAEELIREIAKLEHLELRGLMTMPPFWEPEKLRPFFRDLRQLRDRLQTQNDIALPELSMGLSADFEVAIEEGATMVRIGTAIFGPR